MSDIDVSVTGQIHTQADGRARYELVVSVDDSVDNQITWQLGVGVSVDDTKDINLGDIHKKALDRATEYVDTIRKTVEKARSEA
ncbi:MAG: hypothetical protein OXQ90_08070 [Gammaproteobacteria bacterium]|nr:hypothetical protein [Gammaproteobacteria bacterium]